MLDFKPALYIWDLTGERVLAKGDCICALISVGGILRGDRRAAADLDTSGSFLNWGSGKTFMTEYTGTVTVLQVTAVVVLGGDLSEAYKELDADDLMD